MNPPDYFEDIRREAKARWDSLEADPDNSSVWRLLFLQIQSPRHVLSELLQNADDAGASEVWVEIDEAGSLIFEHNGDDFTGSQFRAICRFGHSSKRSLFTIGFRGIGFKSTFSLGSPVMVQTPTLSVAFHEHRFTEPVWFSDGLSPTNKTRISVKIAGQHRLEEIGKNLKDWIDSPLSLLFFRNIRSINIWGTTLRWQGVGKGPVDGSEWMAFEDNGSDRYLLVRSLPEPFPPKALEEIQKERMIPAGEEEAFPLCSVELVLGHEGGLFVVLPTGGDTGLPFSANAPFMLTPDRDHIKDPAISLVNRWLLERIGHIAASAMLGWLGNEEMPAQDRVEAYEWFPSDGKGDTQDQRNGAWTTAAFNLSIKGQPVLLIDTGGVVKAGEAVMLPPVALETWTPEVASKFLDAVGRPALCRHIGTKYRQKLTKGSLVSRVEDKDLLSKLSLSSPPRPQNWEGLMALWRFLHGQYFPVRPLYGFPPLESLRVVPIEGSEFLDQAGGTVRLTSMQAHCRSHQDWEFLTSSLSVVDASWLRFVTEADRVAVEKAGRYGATPQEPAAKLLNSLNLDQPTGVSRLLDRAAHALLEDHNTTISAWVRLAHIAAALDAEAGEHFRFVTRDGGLRKTSYEILHDFDGGLEPFLPYDYVEEHLLHSTYSVFSETCKPGEWAQWIQSGKSRLVDLPAVREKCESFPTWQDFETRLSVLQSVERLGYPHTAGRRYPSQTYYFTDFDFAPELVHHWLSLPEIDRVWSVIAKRLLCGNRWRGHDQVIGKQTTTSGGNPLIVGGIHCASAWLRRLLSIECLPDKHGIFHVPADLMRRTPETEALFDVEAFVDGAIDTEHNRDFLNALGVASKPRGANKLVGCLVSLKQAQSLPLAEIEKWYRRLDVFTANCSATDLSAIADAFAENLLMLSRDHTWHAPGEIFVEADEADAPGLPLVIEVVKDLRLWDRLKVASRPSADAVVSWLRKMPEGKVADAQTLGRVEAMLMRYPVRIWNETGHWMDLAGRWMPVGNLDHCMDSRQRIAWSNLHEWVKQRTADCRKLLPEVAGGVPFSTLRLLENAVTDRLLTNHSPEGHAVDLPWLGAFGEALARLTLDEDEKMAAVRETGRRLSKTTLRYSLSIQVTPYFEAKPAGTSRQQQMAWIGTTIFCAERKPARMARLLPEHLGRHLPTDSLREALSYCYDRRAGDVADYMEANFILSEAVGTKFPTGQESLSETDPVENGAELPTPDDDPQPGLQGDQNEPVSDNPTRPDGESGPTSPSPHKPPGPNLMEHFAVARGFYRDGKGFAHPDGSRLVKEAEGGFGWCLNDAVTRNMRHFRAIDACLDRQPVEIPHESWSAIELAPDAHSLILRDLQGHPVEISGSTLCRMKQAGIVKLFPATYRLRRT